jgi:nicotinamidase-related amidase
MNNDELKIPPHFKPEKVGSVWKVDYQARATDANNWADEYNIGPSGSDKFKICLLAIDMQNTFCVPGYELFVSGRSGNGAVEDTKRLCEFIYRNLNVITQIIPTMDTHQPMQIFHSIFLINDKGENPPALSLISADDIEKGVWKINENVCLGLGVDPGKAQNYLKHYTQELNKSGKYELTIWPYHAMLGGLGHALASPIEEAIFFHSIARCSQPNIQIKGNNPLTEHYSVFGPEVKSGIDGEKIANKNIDLIERVLKFDAIIIGGEAKSHCAAWSIEDLLNEILLRDKKLAQKVYLLEDCSSPVVVPGVVDYTDEADKAYSKFAEAGMHLVKSTTPILEWPGIKI